MDYKRLFLNWLKQRHIRDNFLHNCRTVRSVICGRHSFPIKYIWNEDPVLYIVNSFSWHDSFEGFCFWYDYDFLWRNYFHQYMSTHNI